MDRESQSIVELTQKDTRLRVARVEPPTPHVWCVMVAAIYARKNTNRYSNAKSGLFWRRGDSGCCWRVRWTSVDPIARLDAVEQRRDECRRPPAQTGTDDHLCVA